MRYNNNNNNNQRGYSRGPKYSTKGETQFLVEGYVQTVKQDDKHNCDYVTLYIDSPINEGKYDQIGVRISHDLPLPDEGDRVCITGFMRSWYTDNRTIIELNATDVQEVIEG